MPLPHLPRAPPQQRRRRAVRDDAGRVSRSRRATATRQCRVRPSSPAPSCTSVERSVLQHTATRAPNTTQHNTTQARAPPPPSQHTHADTRTSVLLRADNVAHTSQSRTVCVTMARTHVPATLLPRLRASGNHLAQASTPPQPHRGTRYTQLAAHSAQFQMTTRLLDAQTCSPHEALHSRRPHERAPHIHTRLRPPQRHTLAAERPTTDGSMQRAASLKTSCVPNTRTDTHTETHHLRLPALMACH